MTAKRVRFDIRQAQKPILIGLAVLLVANVAYFLAAVRPKLAEFRELDLESNPRTQALQQRRSEVETLEAFVASLRQASVDLRTLREEVLSTREERFIDVQQEIDTLCQEFGINLELVTYEHDTLAAEELEFARITVPLQGGYAALRRFLEAVEGSEKFLVVERIALGQGKDGGVLLQLNITLTTYFNAPADAMRVARGRRA